MNIGLARGPSGARRSESVQALPYRSVQSAFGPSVNMWRREPHTYLAHTYIATYWTAIHGTVVSSGNLPPPATDTAPAFVAEVVASSCSSGRQWAEVN